MEWRRSCPFCEGGLESKSIYMPDTFVCGRSTGLANHSCTTGMMKSFDALMECVLFLYRRFEKWKFIVSFIPAFFEYHHHHHQSRTAQKKKNQNQKSKIEKTVLCSLSHHTAPKIPAKYVCTHCLDLLILIQWRLLKGASVRYGSAFASAPLCAHTASGTFPRTI